jgi:hypothetical protein
MPGIGVHATAPDVKTGIRGAAGKPFVQGGFGEDRRFPGRFGADLMTYFYILHKPQQVVG